MTRSKAIERNLDRVVRRERGRLIADLVRRLGNQHFALAEDVAQDALVKAMSVWPFNGLPDSPGAWLAKTDADIEACQRLHNARDRGCIPCD